ncbi:MULTISPECIES: glycoside hydrolase domain-containing protein [Nocardioides]|uniref:Glycoside hydrolase domain-containing protein n=1 Tax=Nocardioides vastitatis TaxID=2568655 RepID=A0ABW0ZCV7_9ACTN|nr:glycoside hydrolase domain-containing protein [Nocardioides sp.]THI95311.1 DUF1906 domain-containing protein [Nocardioides sp.]
MSARLELPASRPRLGPPLRRTVTAALGAVLALALLAPLHDAPETPAASTPVDLAAAEPPNPVTPGSFRGYGFDQCLTPTQAKMDAWLQHSPFLAVGVYISGNSRFCRHQPNLTSAWVRTQLAKGWRILPITLGPQSTCVGRFPRYGANIDPTISNNSANRWSAARGQGRLEASRAVAAAQALGISPGSTIWYDLEGWSNYRHATCRESALHFLTAWTNRIRRLNYVSGVYSSAGSGIKILDDARATRRSDVVLPDQIWIARWDGKASTSTSYIREDGWRPGNRMKQYRGGHNETWGGVTINIDSNYLDLGAPRAAAETHCGSATIVDPARYRAIRKRTTTYRPHPASVKALQCLLREKGVYPGRITGNYNRRTRAAVQAWQKRVGHRVSTTWTFRNWMTLLSAGPRPVLKIGSTGPDVRRVQRTIHATMPRLAVQRDGIFDADTAADVAAYRREIGMGAAGIVNTATWRRLQAGTR